MLRCVRKSQDIIIDIPLKLAWIGSKLLIQRKSLCHVIVLQPKPGNKTFNVPAVGCNLLNHNCIYSTQFTNFSPLNWSSKKTFSWLYLALMELPWTETSILKYWLASSQLKITRFWDGHVSLLYHLKRERCLFSQLSQAQQNCMVCFLTKYL